MKLLPNMRSPGFNILLAVLEGMCAVTFAVLAVWQKRPVYWALAVWAAVGAVRSALAERRERAAADEQAYPDGKPKK